MLRINKLIRSLRYIYHFGIKIGLRNIFSTKTKKEYGSFIIPRYKNHVFFRPKSSDIKIFEQIFMDKSLNFKISDFQPKYIVDAGANAGYVSLYFANKYPSSKIIAIEPESSNYKLLLKNIKSYKNIIPLKVALWNKGKKLQIENLESEKWSFRMVETNKDNSNVIEGLTLANIMNKFKIEKIDILKLDIEGGEKQLFSSNYKNWLDKVKLIYIELHDRHIKGCSKSFYHAICQYDFEQFIHKRLLVIKLNHDR